jgi:hypothetical protein
MARGAATVDRRRRQAVASAPGAGRGEDAGRPGGEVRGRATASWSLRRTEWWIRTCELGRYVPVRPAPPPVCCSWRITQPGNPPGRGVRHHVKGSAPHGYFRQSSRITRAGRQGQGSGAPRRCARPQERCGRGFACSRPADARRGPGFSFAGGRNHPSARSPLQLPPRPGSSKRQRRRALAVRVDPGLEIGGRPVRRWRPAANAAAQPAEATNRGREYRRAAAGVARTRVTPSAAVPRSFPPSPSLASLSPFPTLPPEPCPGGKGRRTSLPQA